MRPQISIMNSVPDQYRLPDFCLIAERLGLTSAEEHECRSVESVTPRLSALSKRRLRAGYRAVCLNKRMLRSFLLQRTLSAGSTRQAHWHSTCSHLISSKA